MSSEPRPESLTQQLGEREKHLKALEQAQGHRSPDLESLVTTIANLKSALSRSQSLFSCVSFVFPPSKSAGISITPRFFRNQIAPALQQTRQRRSEIADIVSSNFDHAYSGMDCYLEILATAMYNAQHPDASRFSDIEKRRQEAELFNKILSALSNRTLGYSLDARSGQAVATIGGRLFSPGDCSDGEQALIAWAIALNKQAVQFRDETIFIDEPEIHLHPAACASALKRLSGVLSPQGQMFVATHSLPLIAAFSDATPFHVHDGTVDYSGNNLAKVVDSLLGGAEGRRHVLDYIGSSNELEFISFAAQCLTAPTVAGPSHGDPQANQLTTIMHARMCTHRTVRILDYGAGRGRLLRELDQAFSRIEPLPAIEYSAYNHPADYETHRAECEALT